MFIKCYHVVVGAYKLCFALYIHLFILGAFTLGWKKLVEMKGAWESWVQDPSQGHE